MKLPTAAEMFGAECSRLELAPPAPYKPCNPSIVYDGWKWQVSIRCVDYELGKTNPDGASSLNYLTTLDGRLGIDHVTEMADRSGAPTYAHAKIRGFEDLRLFYRGNQLCALASSANLLGGTYRKGGWGRPEMCYLTIGRDGAITSARALRGLWSNTPQKNWMPIADGTGRRFLYRTIPELVVFVDDVITWKGDPLTWVPSSLRGSSQLIWFDGGWLMVAHESRKFPTLQYRHRFVWYDTDFVARKASKDFVWLSPGVEFCAGLATDGRRFVATFGKEDREAHLAVLQPRAVSAHLRPIHVH